MFLHSDSMKKVYGNTLIFIVGISVGWNLKGTNKKPRQKKDEGAAKKLLRTSGGDNATTIDTNLPWYADILKGDVHIWNGKEPLGSAAKPCRWQDVTIGGGGSSTLQIKQMCRAEDENEKDSRSSTQGEISTCAHLPKRTKQGIYVDVGSGFGACVLTVLAQTKAKVIAVEPHPIKLYHLTSTLLRLDLTLRDRVVVLPIAAGHRDDLAYLFTAERNYAGTIGEEFRNESVEVAIRRLDAVLATSTAANRITLMKIDAQGMECDILRGTRGLKMDQIYLETHESDLKRFNCSRSTLEDLSEEHGFLLKDDDKQIGPEDEGRVALVGTPR